MSDQAEERTRLGRMIQEARVKHDMTVEHLAGLVGLTPMSIASIEDGITPIGTNHLRAISSALSLNFSLLLDASRVFQATVWKDNEKATIEGEDLMVRMISRPSAERVMLDFQEGWIAGATNRPITSAHRDLMSHDWKFGYARGADVFESEMEGFKVQIESNEKQKESE